MKIILTLSLVLFSLSGYSKSIDSRNEYSQPAEGSVQQRFVSANHFWFSLMKKDFVKKVIDQVYLHSVEDFNADALAPRASFTKPHRFLLLDRFQKEGCSRGGHNGYTSTVTNDCQRNYEGDYFYYGAKTMEIQGDKKTITFLHFNQQRNDQNQWQWFVPSAGELDSYIALARDDLNNSVHSSNERFFPFLTDALLYPIASEYVLLTEQFLSENGIESLNTALPSDFVLTQDRRWWFNSNIKPLLEKMIMVWDLFHGEYEAY